MKILIMETDWQFAGKVTRYLESHAHLVVNYSDTSEALKKINGWKPDLVILSADLAEKDLLNGIHAVDGRPAILLTGWMERYDVAWRAWQAGGDDLLLKPVLRSEELEEAILTARENAISGGATQRQQASA
jgi:DNA-binding response OmpR family regulator